MNAIALVLALAAAGNPRPAALKSFASYTLRIDARDLSGWTVEMRLHTISDTVRLAMAAHPEYDDRYWRYVRDFTVDGASGRVTKVDSAVWQIVTPQRDFVVRYRIALPPAPQGPRGAWRPFLSATGGLSGGPHTFMYLLGAERMRTEVTLELPADWRMATALERTASAHTFTAPNAAALMDAPILMGALHEWRFVAGGVPHRIAYWAPEGASAFDTAAFVSGIEQIARQAIALFGGVPYREYTFLVQDGAYGGLEHASSVTIGVTSADLAKNPYAALQETAHEFIHTWNLMAITPVEYRSIDYRTQPPVSSLWFSEGLTIMYADRLLRRAGLPAADSTPAAHLARLLGSYLANPAYAQFSAEAVSRVAYNAEPGALGDYGASTHQQGEVIGTVLDLIVRDATQGRRSMDDVMRALFAQWTTPIDGSVIENAVEAVCGCDVTPFFDAHVRGAGAIDINRYLASAGQQIRVTWGPAVRDGQPERDLRMWGWEPESGGLRLVVTNPTSTWARAGLHSGDQLERIDGQPVATFAALRARLQRTQLGDTLRIDVRRPGGPFTATVVVAGFQRPTVIIEPVSVRSSR